MAHERELIESHNGDKRCVRCIPRGRGLTALALIGLFAGCGMPHEDDITGVGGGAAGNEMQVPWTLPQGGITASIFELTLPGSDNNDYMGFGIVNADASQTVNWLWDVVIPSRAGSYDLERPGCATTAPSFNCPVNQTHVDFLVGPARAFGETGRTFTSIRGRVDVTVLGPDCIVGELQAVLREENGSEFDLIGDGQVVALRFRLREGREKWPPDPPVQCN